MEKIIPHFSWLHRRYPQYHGKQVEIQGQPGMPRASVGYRDWSAILRKRLLRRYDNIIQRY